MAEGWEHKTVRLAGVDIGTLTCRLLIADVDPAGRLAEQHSDRRILRLGEGLERSGRLLPAAMARVIDTLRTWRGTITAYGVDGETAVATSAVREAKNREEFLTKVHGLAGFAVEVISGEEEARRTLLGIRAGLPVDILWFVGIDIGGGSTEFILDHPGQAPVIRSTDIGVVRFTERFLKADPPSPGDIQAMRQAVRVRAQEAKRVLDLVEGGTLVGTAGTITTLAAMAQRLVAYEPARVHNSRLSLATIDALEHEILSRTSGERRGLPGLEPGREEVIAAGAVILKEAMETLGFTDCLVSNWGLREGAVLNLAARLVNQEGSAGIGRG